MKINVFLFLLLPGGFAFADTGMISPIEDLTKRIAGNQATAFVYQQISSDGDKDVFELESTDSKIMIKGNNYNSMATGLSYYLKYYCKVTVITSKNI